MSNGENRQYWPAYPSALFPLVRHLSVQVTPLLAKTPLSANQVTTISMVFGLACSWLVAQGNWALDVAGGVMLVFCYVLDNCDGEIARIKNQSTPFGKRYDSFVDFVVHVSFFACLGFGVAKSTGQDIWLWMGWTAALGGIINYAVGIYIDSRSINEPGNVAARDETGLLAALQPRKPEGILQWAVFILRELTRADFCFIVLGLALFDLDWVLLPAGAIGAQLYWCALFIRGVNDFHV